LRLRLEDTVISCLVNNILDYGLIKVWRRGGGWCLGVVGGCVSLLSAAAGRCCGFSVPRALVFGTGNAPAHSRTSVVAVPIAQAMTQDALKGDSAFAGSL
jgi:hypothetical protein